VFSRSLRVQLRRQDRRFIAEGFVKLRVGQVARLRQVRAAEIGTGKSGSSEISMIEQRLAEIGIGKVGAVEPRIGEIGAGQIGAVEIGARQCSKAQRCPPQPRRSEIDRAAIDLAHLALADAQGNSGEVGDDGGVLTPPSVPRSRATTQKVHMVRIG
jgi:hypothetical protein